MPLSTQKTTVLIKTETTEGVNANPTPALNALGVENATYELIPNMITTDERTGSFDQSADIVGGQRIRFSGSFIVKGSGSLSTLPAWAPILAAVCQPGAVNSAVSPAAAQNGGTETSVVFNASGFSTVNDFYNGKPVTIEGVTSFVRDYVGATKTAYLTDIFPDPIDNTMDAGVPANILFSPVSNNDTSITYEHVVDGKVFKGVGCRGTASISLEVAGIMRISYTLEGMYDGTEEIDMDAFELATVYLNQDEEVPVAINGKFFIDGVERQIDALTLDIGNNTVASKDLNQPQGYAAPQVNKRKTTGTIAPFEVSEEVQDTLTDYLRGTRVTIHARFGVDEVGKRWAITVTSALLKTYTPADRDGFYATTINFDATGKNTAWYLTNW